MRIDSHHSFSERYTLEYLETILKRNRFDGSVVVPAVLPPVLLPIFPDFVKAIVVQADLLSPELPRLLDEYQRRPKFRGICHRFHDEIPEGLGELERRRLRLDAMAAPSLIPRIVDRYPGLRIVIDHVGQVDGLLYELWERDIAEAAQFPQVFCKLSGVGRLGTSARAYVQHSLDVFGPHRLMFGSDWPACLPEISWKASLAAFTQALGAQTIEVREELLGGTAERFYEL